MCDNLFKIFGKTSRQAVEFSEMFSKATRAVTDSVKALGRFEEQNGEDENHVLKALKVVWITCVLWITILLRVLLIIRKVLLKV